MRKLIIIFSLIIMLFSFDLLAGGKGSGRRKG